MGSEQGHLILALPQVRGLLLFFLLQYTKAARKI